MRVLDLTRILAGPVATRFLAGFGADVLRIDPPGWNEPALVPEVTLGKRLARLDLHQPEGRQQLADLLSACDVLVHGYRADALSRLGFGAEERERLRPGLVDVSLNAYGWTGPWRNRRGFDSLVQMSCGIAAFGAAAAGTDAPVPLPVQALDHATGYLIAAAIGRALTRRLADSVVTRVRACLTGTASLLWSLPRPESMPPRPSPAGFPLVDAMTAWGPARRVPLPGQIAGSPPRWQVEAGPLARHAAAWL
jgi:crotonobetainyl-CoA:carnitine CoA-transferase CaiB-like acyl-CoA transferase